MGPAWDKVTGMQEKKKGSSPALAGSEKTLRPRERFTGTEARLGLKSLWVQLQRAGCCGCRLGGGASALALAGEGAGCEGWLAACPGEDTLFPFLSP